MRITMAALQKELTTIIVESRDVKLKEANNANGDIQPSSSTYLNTDVRSNLKSKLDSNNRSNTPHMGRKYVVQNYPLHGSAFGTPCKGVPTIVGTSRRRAVKKGKDRVPKELTRLNNMTSSDFRDDDDAHLGSIRSKLYNQQHFHYYQRLIEQNSKLFERRTVVVLDCGVGTLALMAARAGAKRVYAIDDSNVVGYAKLVVKANGYKRVIKVLQGTPTNLQLPNTKDNDHGIDIIISNWMGDCLLYNSSLVELIQARDRWLKPRGLILPDRAKLFVVGSAEKSFRDVHLDWWWKVYGFNMNSMRRFVLSEPRFFHVLPCNILTNPIEVLDLDLKIATVDDLFINNWMQFKPNTNGVIDCFVCYFEVEFSVVKTPETIFTCSPWLPPKFYSNWAQTVLFVDEPFEVRADIEYIGFISFNNTDERVEPAALNFRRMKMEIDLFKFTSFGYEKRLVRKRWHFVYDNQTLADVEASYNFDVFDNVEDDE